MKQKTQPTKLNPPQSPKQPPSPSSSPSKNPLIYDKQKTHIPIYRQALHKQIQVPIQIYQSLYQSNIPQKCLTHDIQYTVYCQTDHKILCSRCMLQNNAHKLHTVKPIPQVLPSLTQDCQLLTTDIQQLLTETKTLLQQCQTETTKIQREYPQSKNTLQQIFKTLHQYLFDLQKQYGKKLRNYKQYLIDQQKGYVEELMNVYAFVEGKFNKYVNKNNQDQLVLKKNVFGLLKQCKRVVWEKMKVGDMRLRWGGRYEIKDGVVVYFKSIIENDGDQWFPWSRLTLNKKTQKTLKQPLKATQNPQNSPTPITPIITHNMPKSPNKSKTKQKIQNNLSKLNETQTKIRKSSKSIFPKSPKSSRSKKLHNSRSLSRLSMNIMGEQRRNKLMMKNGLMADDSRDGNGDGDGGEENEDKKVREAKESKESKDKAINNKNTKSQKFPNKTPQKQPQKDKRLEPSTTIPTHLKSPNPQPKPITQKLAPTTQTLKIPSQNITLTLGLASVSNNNSKQTNNNNKSKQYL